MLLIISRLVIQRIFSCTLVSSSPFRSFHLTSSSVKKDREKENLQVTRKRTNLELNSWDFQSTSSPYDRTKPRTDPLPEDFLPRGKSSSHFFSFTLLRRILHLDPDSWNEKWLIDEFDPSLTLGKT